MFPSILWRATWQRSNCQDWNETSTAPGEWKTTKHLPRYRQGLASPLSGERVRIAGMVEAVGWDHTVEEEKGRRVMESLREVFADGAMQVIHFLCGCWWKGCWVEKQRWWRFRKHQGVPIWHAIKQIFCSGPKNLCPILYLFRRFWNFSHFRCVFNIF